MCSQSQPAFININPQQQIMQQQMLPQQQAIPQQQIISQQEMMPQQIINQVQPLQFQQTSYLELSSDHTPVIATLSTHIISRSGISISITTKQTNQDTFRSCINEHITLNLRVKEPQELDEATQSFTTLIQEATYYSTPTQVEGRKKTDNIPLFIRKLVQLPDINSSDHEIESFLETACQMSLPIEAKEVYDKFKKLNPHNAAGYELITGTILRQYNLLSDLLMPTYRNNTLLESEKKKIAETLRQFLNLKRDRQTSVSNSHYLNAMVNTVLISQDATVNQSHNSTEKQETQPLPYAFSFSQTRSNYVSFHLALKNLSVEVETVNATASIVSHRETNSPITIVPHERLNYTKGIISHRNLVNCSVDEIAEALSKDRALQAKRMMTKRNGVSRQAGNLAGETLFIDSGFRINKREIQKIRSRTLEERAKGTGRK
ncbi:hypothetical protein ILUMI_25735 [Ignelater luminosus]|uniref:Uncharacterized protein n=1 Tax=Ignelater luminosus TaxID=2038154 RepID=A0A8K0C7X2_IGNLU|nr:hypothetical protein ILUMI_25735 [Ignelater luminosus]